MAKYTPSGDGVERTTILAGARVTRQELKDLNEQSKQMGYKNFRGWLEHYALGFQFAFEDDYHNWEMDAGNLDEDLEDDE